MKKANKLVKIGWFLLVASLLVSMVVAPDHEAGPAGATQSAIKSADQMPANPTIAQFQELLKNNPGQAKNYLTQNYKQEFAQEYFQKI